MRRCRSRRERRTSGTASPAPGDAVLASGLPTVAEGGPSSQPASATAASSATAARTAPRARLLGMGSTVRRGFISRGSTAEPAPRHRWQRLLHQLGHGGLAPGERVVRRGDLRPGLGAVDPGVVAGADVVALARRPGPRRTWRPRRRPPGAWRRPAPDHCVADERVVARRPAAARGRCPGPAPAAGSRPPAPGAAGARCVHLRSSSASRRSPIRGRQRGQVRRRARSPCRSQGSRSGPGWRASCSRTSRRGTTTRSLPPRPTVTRSVSRSRASSCGGQRCPRPGLWLGRRSRSLAPPQLTSVSCAAIALATRRG